MDRRNLTATRLLLLFLAATTLLAGCTTTAINLQDQTKLSQAEGVVFGRVVVLRNGEEVGRSLFGGGQISLFIVGKDSSLAEFVPVEEGGAFSWHLPAGQYTIAGFELLSGGRLSGQVYADFAVEAAKATYIGTLNIKFYGGRYFIGIEDDHDTALDDFLGRFPRYREGCKQNLMQMEVRK